MHKLVTMLTGWSLQRITKSYEFHQNTWHSGFVSSLSTALLSAACWSIMTCVRAWAGQPGRICGSAGCNALQELFEDLHWILWSLGFRFGQCLQKRPGICKSRFSLTLLSDTLSNVQKAINGISWYIIGYWSKCRACRARWQGSNASVWSIAFFCFAISVMKAFCHNTCVVSKSVVALALNGFEFSWAFARLPLLHILYIFEVQETCLTQLPHVLSDICCKCVRPAYLAPGLQAPWRLLRQLPARVTGCLSRSSFRFRFQIQDYSRQFSCALTPFKGVPLIPLILGVMMQNMIW